jgi:hypothetical protein
VSKTSIPKWAKVRPQERRHAETQPSLANILGQNPKEDFSSHFLFFRSSNLRTDEWEKGAMAIFWLVEEGRIEIALGDALIVSKEVKQWIR